MLPLHLRIKTSATRVGGSWWGRLLLRGAVAACVGALAVAPTRGQDRPENAGAGKPAQDQTAPDTHAPDKSAPETSPAAATPNPEIHFRERPHYPSDSRRLRRTVQIDGVMSEGEWDPFYTVTEGPIKGTVYCNWDDNYLYLAARTDQPADLLFDVDMGGDGWLRGADNLEVVVGGIAEGGMPTVTARLLDAASSKDAPVWNEKSIDPKSLMVAGKIADGAQFVELAIPKNTASLVLRPGAALGVRAEFLPGGTASQYTPTAPFEPHLLLEAVLTESRDRGEGGINPRLILSDYKCIAGEDLVATLELRNQTDLTVPIRSVLWTGSANSVDAVNTLREVTVPPLPGLKTLKLKYHTPLPVNLPVGSYTLLVTADMGNGRQLQSSAAFNVVEPLQVQISSDPQPVAILGQTKLTLSLDVFSAVPDHMRGDVELTSVPPGWEVQGKLKRGIYVDGKDSHGVTRYTLKLSSTTQAGDYPIEANVTWHGRTWKLHHVVQVLRTDLSASNAAK